MSSTCAGHYSDALRLLQRSAHKGGSNPSVRSLGLNVLLPLQSDGRIVFHGPIAEVLPFFAAQGFAPPARKGVADFLQVRHTRAALVLIK